MMTINDFVHKHNLKKRSIKTKIYQVLSTLLLSAIGIHLRDGPFSNDRVIVNLHPSKGTHRVAYVNENYF